MVDHSGAPARAHQLRPLNQPRPLRVATDAGRIAAIGDGVDLVEVESVQDRWRVAAEWWRDPIRRRYYRVRTVHGGMRTIYYDVIRDGWFEQAY